VGTSPVTSANTLFAVFSFNRGAALLRCISSIERHAYRPRIVIFDDLSDDRATRRVLKRLEKSYRVIRPDASRPRLGRVGGLQQNMQLALDLAAEDGVHFLFCLQDDQQVVRDLESDFAAQMAEIFDHDESIIEVVPLFIESHLGPRYCEARFGVDASGLFYFAERPDATWGSCDTGVFLVDRLLDHDLRFEIDERDTAERAWSRGLHFVLARDPVMMFTPWPRAVRRRRTRPGVVRLLHGLLIRLNEVGVRAGRARLLDMTPDEVRHLKRRPVTVLPYAEHFLRTDRRVPTPWFFSDCFDRRKLRGRYFLAGKWLWDGPVEYLERVKENKEWFRSPAFIDAGTTHPAEERHGGVSESERPA